MCQLLGETALLKQDALGQGDGSTDNGTCYKHEDLNSKPQNSFKILDVDA